MLIGVLFGLCLLATPLVILYLLLQGAAGNKRTRENVAALESRLVDLKARVESLTLRTARLEDENEKLRARAIVLAGDTLTAPPAIEIPAQLPLEVVVPHPPEEFVPISPEVPRPLPPAAPVREEPGPIPLFTGAIEPPLILPKREDRGEAPRVAWREQLAGRDWEALVGGNWLNKAGVLVFIMGLSLFLGYSLTRFGPAGRVAIGWGISVALLAGGTLLERRPGYALFGHGLLAGGWGGAYFTAYAMHVVPAARVIESPIAGAVLLMSVATGMVLHSLRYRSEALTGLTYFIAFATLNITPVSAFTLLASAPLAASLLTITYRHRWTTMSVVGLTFTYGSLLMRLGTSMSSATVGELWIVQAILVTYWLLFELFDLIALRSRTSGPLLGALFPLNATGFLGLSVLLWSDHPRASVYLYGLSAAGYLASAVARALLKPARPPADAGVPGNTGNDDLLIAPGYEASATVGAALAAVTIVLEFHGIQRSTALALEGELLFMSGLRLKASYLRGLASIVLMGALVTTLPVLTASSPDTMRPFGVTLYVWAPMAALIAAVFYMNAALVRSTTRIAAEPFYLGAGTALLVGIVGYNTPVHHLGIAWLVLAFGLLEAGIRTKADQLLFQALLVGTLAVGDILWITEFRGGASHPSLMLGVSGALTAVAAFRLFNSSDVKRPIHQFLRDAAALASVVLLTFCAWHALSGPMVAVAWGALALALVNGGRALDWRFLAGTGDVLAMVVFARLFAVNMRADGPLWGLSTRLVTVVPCVALFYYLGASIRGERALSRDWRARAFAWMASALAVSLMLFELERALTATGWSAFAVGLLVVALRRKDDDLLNQSYLVAAGASIRAWIVNAEGPDWVQGGLSIELMAAGVVVLCLYACQFLVPREWANVQGTGPISRRWIDRHARALFSGVATALLALVLFHDVPSRLLTVAWALQGLMLLAVGFTAREPVLRRSGLVLLAVCLTKVLGYDSRQLDTLARIVSFMLLGAVLILVSWIYTRFGSRVRRFL